MKATWTSLKANFNIFVCFYQESFTTFDAILKFSMTQPIIGDKSCLSPLYLFNFLSFHINPKEAGSQRDAIQARFIHLWSCTFFLCYLVDAL